MGGKKHNSPPTPTLPHQGGGELFEGDVHDIPPPVSPREVEGSGEDLLRGKLGTPLILYHRAGTARCLPGRSAPLRAGDAHPA
jgi:hypothetical protein